MFSFQKDQRLTPGEKHLYLPQGGSAYDDIILKRRPLLPQAGQGRKSGPGSDGSWEQGYRVFIFDKIFDYPISLKWKPLKYGVHSPPFRPASELFGLKTTTKRRKIPRRFYINRFRQAPFHVFEKYTEKSVGTQSGEIALTGCQLPIAVMALVMDMFKRKITSQQEEKVSWGLLIKVEPPRVEARKSCGCKQPVEIIKNGGQILSGAARVPNFCTQG